MAQGANPYARRFDGGGIALRMGRLVVWGRFDRRRICLRSLPARTLLSERAKELRPIEQSPLHYVSCDSAAIGTVSRGLPLTR